MNISSSAFKNGANIPATYTCDGENINPPLMFSDVPKETISLALIMEDPDVPSNVRADNMWNHWIVFNISPQIVGIEEGIEPTGTHGITTSGKLKYGGPCPPDRRHRYFFKLYALNTLLDLPEGVSKLVLEKAMEGHILARAGLMGTYARGK
ncbi:MAG: YbhB/YbcL family Raf kinase inhibitor-like protein [Patescibacteria group bacterium]